MIRTLVTVAALTAGLSSLAAAHAGLQTIEAPAGSQYRAVISIPHGCAGAATNEVRVRVPDGMIAINPMPKAGWELETVMEPLDEPYMDHGREVTERIGEVRWTGGDLADAHYDEFTFMARLPNEPGQHLHFPVVQACGDDALRWIDVPASGEGAADTDYPAPVLYLTEPESSGHSHGHDHGHSHDH
ncbi:DUF1775 domain-containing protein [Natronospirillum operosum]|uniref:DUF1775 domain-containing protein n=1 Tax=Natronospirillum operosum TaxID=2759953 RepID=A0A4Z0W4H8_9GAMM|nr:YcnI family protein [Natronospirillum operosum]TGG90238.1 DUF1775 domain-containing protein [Natronospirillum operosum]